MSLDNIKTLLQQQNISWIKVQSYLEENKADQTTIDQAKSIFDNLDKNHDGEISIDEWNKAGQSITEADADNNGEITEEELSNSSNQNLFKPFTSEVTNTFLAAMSNAVENTPDVQAETPEPEDDSRGGGGSDAADIKGNPNYKYDANGNLITYPKEGETFKKTAERLGFKADTTEYNEFLKANQQAGKRNWFRVGEEVKIPPSIQDKVNNEGIIDEQAGKEEVQKYSYRVDARGSQDSSTDKSESKLPKSVQQRIEELKKSGDKYEVTGDAKSGYTVKVSDGAYIKKNKIGEIEIKYDATGKLKTYTQKYNSGRITETTYAGGKKIVEKAKAAPQKYQDLAAKMQKKSGGNARLEYNKNTKKYEVIQTNLPERAGVKEIRTVVSDKSWQENMSKAELARKGLSDFFSSGLDFDKAKKAWDKAIRNYNEKAELEDNFDTQTITYDNGKILTYKYEQGDGRLIKDTTTAVASNNKTVVASSETTTGNNEPPAAKIHVAADISFKMPSNAPENAKKFAESLVDNKEKLMRQLGIDDDTYNMLAQTAIGIAGHESKNFDTHTFRQTAHDTARVVNQQVLDVSNDTIGSKRDWSRGITQLKYSLHIKEDSIKRNMEALGITDEGQLDDPATSAMATIVVLAQLNKRLEQSKYQKGIEAAQGKTVEYEGWQIGKNGHAEKTGITQPWINEVTRQDALCAIWNGRGAQVIEGTLEPEAWDYTRDVRRITDEYRLVENKDSRKQAEATAERTRAFSDMDNNGEMGGIVFIPAMYTDKAKHMNTAAEIKQLKQTLTAKGIDVNLCNQLITALNNGELGFDFGLRTDEMESLTNSDINLILQHLNKLKTKVNADSAINTADGIDNQEAVKLRLNYGSTVAKAEDDFRKEYLNNHSTVYNATDSNPKVLREQSTNPGSSSYVSANGQRRGFMHEKARGVNTETTQGQISNEAKILALAADKVVKQNPNNNNSGYCLTGVKQAMTDAGIDVSTMADFGSVPKYVKNWFAKHPEMFIPVEYVSTGSGTARAINSSDLKNLPAGYIVIWTPESGSTYGDQAGHIVITNGNGQGYSDTTDNLGWGTYNNAKTESGKGEHGHFVVYKLSDNWEVDSSTGKLKLKS